jgi:phosphoribosylaminoimidazole-succinocarboxamide synthase
MAHIPPALLLKSPPLEGLELRGRGKVRDSYNLIDDDEHMLVVASDRLSVYDFVLNTLIPCKGKILSGLNHFWVTGPLKRINTDLIACGADIDSFLPDHLKNNPDLQGRSTIVKIVDSPPVEDIVRNLLSGSGWEAYKETGEVCGHKLPTGLKKNSRLERPLYTPTTKAKVGHDTHLHHQEVMKQHGAWRMSMSLEIGKIITDYSATKDILVGDLKFEMLYRILLGRKRHTRLLPLHGPQGLCKSNGERMGTPLSRQAVCARVG